MERLSEKAIEIINELHTERLDYESEYLPLIDCAQQCAAYEDTNLTPEEVKEFLEEIENRFLLWDQRKYGIASNRLLDILRADRAGRLVVLPEVPEDDRQTFAEDLKELFDDLSNYDPSVGIFGWSHGEAELANALMTVLTRRPPKEAKP